MTDIVLECPHFDWIPESSLPPDWEDRLNIGFSGLGDYYYDSVLSDEAHRKVHAMVDEEIMRLVKANGLGNILDIGTGDGSRLMKIAKAAKSPKLYGVENNEKMARISEAKGIQIRRSDFKKGIPFSDSSMDLALFLSNDFGYVMDCDPGKGVSLRVNALNETYRVLREGGFLCMELMSQDDGVPDKDGLVCRYERVLKVDGNEKFRGTFYLKDFNFHELSRLFGRSAFSGDNLQVQYILSGDFEKPGDTSRVGQQVKTFKAFEGYSLSDFQPVEKGDVTSYRIRYDYVILLEIRKTKR
jgi:SAM-dependent methyltransferase